MSSSDDRYGLGRGFVEATRLNCQHFLWKETLGFNLSPSIPVHANIKIADIGTGTGIWLFDLAKTLEPSAQLEGFDISSSGYPPAEWLPQNVKLSVWNVLEPPPKHLLGQFDVVHIRLFLVIITDGDPRQILTNCLKLLKPGGHLQWDEYDLHAREIVTRRNDVPKENTQKICDFVKRDVHKWVSELPESFRNYALTDVLTTRRQESLALTRPFMEMELIVAEQFAANALKTKTFSENSQELSELVQKVSVELQQGVAIRNTLQIVTGRKPTESQTGGDLARNQSESVVVFVPGAFHVEAHFAPMCTRLAQLSVPAVTVEMPTTASARTSTYRDDVYILRAHLEKLVEEQGKEVVVAAHSYGAVPACQTISGLERSKRKAEGKPGGIVHVLFIAGVLVEQGRKMAEALAGGKAPSWAVFKQMWVMIQDGLLHPENTKSVFYNDLPATEADHWNSLLVPKSASKTTIDVAPVCYDLDVPITALLGTRDPMLDMLEGMVAKNKTPQWRVVRIPAGHSPFLSRKDELAEVIQRCLDG